MLLVLGGLGVTWAAEVRRYSGESAKEGLCEDYRYLRYSLLSNYVGSLAVVRFRAARVAKGAEYASDAPQRDARPASTVAQEFTRLLEVPWALRSDFQTKLWPVAYACGATTRDYPAGAK